MLKWCDWFLVARFSNSVFLDNKNVLTFFIYFVTFDLKMVAEPIANKIYISWHGSFTACYPTITEQVSSACTCSSNGPFWPCWCRNGWCGNGYIPHSGSRTGYGRALSLSQCSCQPTSLSKQPYPLFLVCSSFLVLRGKTGECLYISHDQPFIILLSR